MRYIVSWKIEMPKQFGGAVLKGETGANCSNLSEALSLVKEMFERYWPNSRIQVVEYGRVFSDEISSIPEIKHIKLK